MSWIIPIALLVGLAIWRKLGSDKEEGSGNEDVGNENSNPDEDKNPPKIIDIVVKKGSKGEAVTKCQQRSNAIIHLVRERKKELLKALPDKKFRINQIAELKQLKVDGVFGSKTEAIIEKLSGSTTTTLRTLRNRYKYWDDHSKVGVLTLGGTPAWWFVKQ